jgi:hypothetical protein
MFLLPITVASVPAEALSLPVTLSTLALALL